MLIAIYNGSWPNLPNAAERDGLLNCLRKKLALEIHIAETRVPRLHAPPQSPDQLLIGQATAHEGTACQAILAFRNPAASMSNLEIEIARTQKERQFNPTCHAAASRVLAAIWIARDWSLPPLPSADDVPVFAAQYAGNSWLFSLVDNLSDEVRSALINNTDVI